MKHSLDRIKNLMEQRQFAVLRQEISEMNTADIAALFEELPSDQVVKI